MNKLWAYLRYRVLLIAYFSLSVVVILALTYLSGQEMLYAWYTVGLLLFFLLLILIADGARFLRRRRLLALAAQSLDSLSGLPAPANAAEADYIRLIQQLKEECLSQKRNGAAARNEALEYYTLWVHQIKTPIAALKLVLSDQDDEKSRTLRRELFKIEQYADLALRYMRLTDIASDLLIQRCDLNAVVKECVKKYSVLFIHKGLTVELSPLENVWSDQKWVGFILSQIISNAVKYTNAGGIRVTMRERALTITDTGIGIRPEDLPRIFEKGYTGYNGRVEERSSGIGLYLAKKAADALNIRLSARSQVNIGTSVTLHFPDNGPEFPT